MTETPRPDPWENFHSAGCNSRYVTIAGYSQRCNCGLDAARAADAARLAEQAETIRQLQARERDLENALVRQERLKDTAEARCATLTAALKTARGYVVERLAQANKYDGPPRSGFVDYDLQQIDAALAAAPQGGSTK